MGISAEVNRKAVLGKQGSDVAQAVADGRAELGITFISEMRPNKGVTIAGPFPGALQSPTVYVAAIPVAAQNLKEARAFFAAMTNAEGAKAIRDSGLEPLSGR
jgi:molybdate transport system substrate-binding protein